MVSQGRVAAMIAAKPAERRLVLEEAAGITGLHSRRHEAELRLKGAETNLDRLEDLLTELADQMQRLRRQVRQATRYRNISGHIRRTEAVLLHLRWTEAEAALADARRQRAEIDRRVEALTGAAAALSQRSAEGGAALSGLREDEAAAAAGLQRHLVERDGLIAEAPKDPYFHALRGQMLFEHGRGAEALEAYRQAVRLSPHAGLIRVELGRAAIEVGTRETLVEAVRNLREVVRRTPRSASGWYWLGIAEGRSGRSEFADLALAEHAILTGDVRRAASLAGRAVRKLPESSAAWHRAQDIINRIRPGKAKN